MSRSRSTPPGQRRRSTGSTAGGRAAASTGSLDVTSIAGNDLGDEPSVITAAVQAADAAKGSVAVNANTVTFTPAATFFAGTATIDYTITDKDGEAANSTIVVTIANAAPDIPAADTLPHSRVNASA